MEIPGYRIDGLIIRTARAALYRGRGEHNLAVIIKTPAQDVPTTRELARYQWAYDQALEADPRAPGIEVYREVARSIVAARQTRLEAMNGKAA